MASFDAEIYAALDRALRHLQARWYVFGAQAAILHGAVRFTEDVDVTVDIGTRSHQELVAELAGHGFEPRTRDDRFIEQTRVLPMLHRSTDTPVDIVLAAPGIEDLFFEGAVELDIDGVRVPVARAEDVIVMKILAGRAKDLDDVVAILLRSVPRANLTRAKRMPHGPGPKRAQRLIPAAGYLAEGDLASPVKTARRR